MKHSTFKSLISFTKHPLIIFFVISIGILAIDNTLFYDRQSNKVLVNKDTLRKFVNVQYGIDNADMINGYIDSLDEEKKKTLIDEYLTNEALYNFAMNRSLDKNDEELKSVITAKSKNIIEMMVNAEQPIPSIKEAKAYFEAGNHNYQMQETYDLVLINKKNRDASLTGLLREQKPTLRQLVQMSDIAQFDKVLRQADRSDLEARFGAKQAALIISQQDGTWVGPYATELGFHWMKKQTRPAVNPDFESIKDQVIADLYQLKIDERYQQIIDELIGQLSVRKEV
ncbi:peptidylprolyl isomerase [Vibrio ishigakensis]|nr:peptidylprolyl isomerase [Vibrio ishigakensis]